MAARAIAQNAHQALERDQEALLLLLQPDPGAPALAYARMRVNQAHNALFASLSQAMQEPGFNSRYLSDMRLWVTHSQFIIEHINAMTTLAHDHYNMLTDTLAADYLTSCEVALQSCQQRLEYDGQSTENPGIFNTDGPQDQAVTLMERHLRRKLFHLGMMHTISFVGGVAAAAAARFLARAPFARYAAELALWPAREQNRPRPAEGQYWCRPADSDGVLVNVPDAGLKTQHRTRKNRPRRKAEDGRNADALPAFLLSLCQVVPVTCTTAFSNRAKPSSISANVTTSNGAKRITSRPALRIMSPSRPAACRKFRARPWSLIARS